MNESFDALDIVGATDVGQRKHNEDAYYIDAQQGLTIVADGVGGHDAGEVASAITCEVISREVAAGAPLNDAVRCANREVMDGVAQGRGKAGMASTVVVVHCTGLRYQVAWVGDSRAYLWDGQLKLLTRDHSYVQALLTEGRITLAEARDHPRKNVIVQAVGLQSDEVLQVDENSGTLGPGQLLLLCSDGLSDMVDPAQISSILTVGNSIGESCQSLVNAAVEAGGRDNITVVLIAGSGRGDSQEKAPREIVWSYDPIAGEYNGRQEQEQEQERVAPVVRRVKPKGAALDSLESTQIMRADRIIGLQKAASGVPRRRRVLFIVLGCVALASLIYSLGLSGIVWKEFLDVRF